MSEAFDQFQALLKQRRYREAASLAERESLQGGEPAFWLTQQSVALVRAGDAAAALEAANGALAVEPSNPYAIVAAADSLFALERAEEALSHYREALPFPKLAPRARKGVLECLGRLKRWEEVLSLLAQWAMPEDQTASAKVKALAGAGRRDEAIDECRRWLQRMPDHPQALWALTDLEVERDGLPAVLERMERTVRIPSLPAVYREIYASLCRRAGRPEAALEVYEKLEAQGAGPRVQRRQAFLLAKSGKEREALPLLEELLRAEPGDMFLHSSYEAACRRIGAVERAINFYTALLGQHPEVKGLYGRIKTLHRALERAGNQETGPGAAPGPGQEPTA
jgi:tetratricopeptide (TPR) repeat protein